MPALSKDRFGKQKHPAVERIPLPEVGDGEYVCVRKLSAKDLLELQQSRGKEGDLGDLGFAYELLARTLCDDAGTLLFGSKEELAASFELPLDCFERLGKEACRVSGLGVTEKNSPPQSATASHSASSSATATRPT